MQARSTLCSPRRSSNSPREGKSATLAFDATYSNHTRAPRPTLNAWNACTMSAESGLLEYPLMSAASALVLSIQWMTRLPLSSVANVLYAATAARSSS
eukprot:3052824-Pleurochrysis_carterae.AAC.1